MTTPTLDLASVVNALFKPDEMAWSLVARGEIEKGGLAVDLRALAEASPDLLPSYWTLSVPSWFDSAISEERGEVSFEFLEDDHPRKKTVARKGGIDGSLPIGQSQIIEAYGHSPFLLFEIDYLFFNKDDKDIGDKGPKQAEKMAAAFIASKFPFTYLTYTGGKSIHACVRLDDSQEQITQWRSSIQFKHLHELALAAFGEYDRNVLTTSGTTRLFRVPGALRDNGNRQTLLGVGRRYTIQELMQWFYSNLSQNNLQSMSIRQPFLAVGPERKYNFYKHKWQQDLIKREHTEGERGTHWWQITKSLAMAGLRQPTLNRRPTGKYDYSAIDAPWLWWVTALQFDEMTNGWFFDGNNPNWNEAERMRWHDESDVQIMVMGQTRVSAGAAPLAQAMKETEAAKQEAGEQNIFSTPIPIPPPTTISTDKEETPAITGDKVDKPKGLVNDGSDNINYTFMAEEFFRVVMPLKHVIKCTNFAGDNWYIFHKTHWVKVSKQYMLSELHIKVLTTAWKSRDREETLKQVECLAATDDAWQQESGAVAFKNGTLYVEEDMRFEQNIFDPLDRIRHIVPYEYGEKSPCPMFEENLRRFVPDEGRRAVIQEMVGYTFLPQQPFQAFFLLLGTGANFKGTLLRIIEAMHGKACGAVSLSAIGRAFTLGNLADLRVTIDGDADQLTGKSADTNMITSTIKAWTGGDSVQIEAKNVQPWSTTMNPKLIMAANKRPRLVDPSRGVWRRLKIIKFDVTIQPDEIIPDYHKVLIEKEMDGIIAWAMRGLRRLIQQNGFTRAQAIEDDVTAYQESMDNVLQFVSNHCIPDLLIGWTAIAPMYRVYKEEHCQETGTHACGMEEFIERIRTAGYKVAKPDWDEPVNGAYPNTFIPSQGHKHENSVKGLRCKHHKYMELALKTINPSVKTVVSVASMTTPLTTVRN